ncbi:hypothetical protein [Flavobacterium sp.]|uniref:hypothetical protein n=1 Tax=Flavobacterium sp. TaxID=239 RepID=UPI002ED99CE0
MSVAAFTLNPDNIETFYVPIASEIFFNTYWIPALRETQTVLLSDIIYGIDLCKNDLNLIIKDLGVVKDWAIKNLEKDPLEHMLARINLLELKLPLAFTDVDSIVFIG